MFHTTILRPHVFPFRRNALLSVAALLAACPAFAATPDNYQGPDGGLWSDPNNWSAGVPNDTFDATIDSAAPITVLMDVNNQLVHDLFVSSPDTLNLLATMQIVGSAATNSGMIVFNATASAPTLLANSLQLSGGGELLMNSTSSLIGGSGNFKTDNLIIGMGSIGQGLRISNSGSISAAGGRLLIFSNAAGTTLTNTGLLCANGGTLSISSEIVNNLGGTIEAFPNSSITINNIPLSGGTVLIQDGASFNLSNASTLSAVDLRMTNSSLNGTGSASTLSGTLTSTGQVTVSGTLNFTGTISNTGILSLLDGSNITMSLFPQSGSMTLGAAQLALQVNATLSSPVLMNSSASKFGGVKGKLLTNQSLIIGQGSLGTGTILITNSGTITASGGTLTVAASSSMVNTGSIIADGGFLNLLTACNNTGGIIEAIHGSAILVAGTPDLTFNFASANITGGTIQSLDGSTITLRSTEIGALLRVVGSQSNLVIDDQGAIPVGGSDVDLSKLDNTGTIWLRSGATAFFTGAVSNTGMIIYNNTFPNFSEVITTATTGVQLSGGGTIVLNPAIGSGANYLGSDGLFVTDNLIIGAGILGQGMSTPTTFKIVNNGSIVASNGVISLIVANTSNAAINNGLMRADGGTLTLTGGTYSNNGSIECLANSVVNVNAALIGGTLLDNGTINFNAAAQIANITGSGIVTVSAGKSLTSDGVLANTLSIAGTHTLRANNATTGTSKVFSLLIANSTGAFSGTLNLTNNKLILQTDPTIPGDKAGKMMTISSALASGYHNGDWLGAGITSSTVAADQSATGSHLTTLALFDNADLNFSSFGGLPADTNSLFITTALIADSNLDGAVDAADFNAWYANRLTHSYSFTRGDFNGDGAIDGLDFDLWFARAPNAPGILANLNLDAPTLSALRLAPVPEPASALFLLLPGILLIQRRSAPPALQKRKRQPIQAAAY